MKIIQTFENFSQPIPITEVGKKKFTDLVKLKSHIKSIISKGYSVDKMLEDADKYPFDLRDVLQMMKELW